MATQAHCAYCFESLAASFENRRALSLAEVQDLWARYNADDVGPRPSTAINEAGAATTKPAAAITRLLNRVTRADGGSNPSGSSATSSRSNLSSTTATTATSSNTSSRSRGSRDPSGSATPASSISSTTGKGLVEEEEEEREEEEEEEEEEEYPLFVTWNTMSKSGRKSLRGCLGIFEPYELDYGLGRFALRSAFEDHRFSPIPHSLLPSLGNQVTLLTNFSTGTTDPYAWTIGQHGLRISFTCRGQRLGATYLPDIASEQGWTQEETLVSLMRKAGWSGGNSSSWEKVWRDGKGELVTYEGKPAELTYPEWKEWRDWVDEVQGSGR